MEFGRRNTRSFSFKEPEIEELKSLIPKIKNPTDFQKKYGSIIPLMKRKMKEGILGTLVQFYDPKIGELMSLIPEIESSTNFRKKYGSIVPLMKLNMKKGILSTLV